MSDSDNLPTYTPVDIPSEAQQVNIGSAVGLMDALTAGVKQILTQPMTMDPIPYPSIPGDTIIQPTTATQAVVNANKLPGAGVIGYVGGVLTIIGAVVFFIERRKHKHA